MNVPLLNPYLQLFNLLIEDPHLDLSQFRKGLIWAYAWAIPSNEAIREIARHSPLVDYGAGTGYWSWLLEQAGATVIAMDQEPAQRPHWCNINRAEVTSLKQLSNHALFMSWPPVDSCMAEEALIAYAGNQVIYVGEWRGRTGTSAFHDRLERYWTRIQTLAIPSWPGFNDQLTIWERVQ